MYLTFLPICIFFAVIYMYVELKKHYTAAVILKGLASLSFVALGISGTASFGDTEFRKLVVIGLILGCIADVLLNLRLVFPKVGQKIFLLGILVFLAGHIFYLCALLPRCDNVFLYVLIGVVLTVLCMLWILKKISAEKVFKIFGFFYIGAIMIMNCVSAGAYITNPTIQGAFFFVGAIAFLISDIVLILNTFGSTQKDSLRVVNLFLYYFGQILIALSLHY